MAPDQTPRPTWPANRHYVPPFRKKLPCGYFENLPRDMWIIRTKDCFQMLIRTAEGLPSNGAVRRVDRPDGERDFAVAYGAAPDEELHQLLEKIYNKHGEVTLSHDGRDSTGKHWIKCFSKPRPGAFHRPIEKATITVYSKFQLATIASLRMREAAAAGKAKPAPPPKKKEWPPPKVPGALPGAPDHLFFLPWKKQLMFLEPEAAEALRERKEKEMGTWEEMGRGDGEARRGGRG